MCRVFLTAAMLAVTAAAALPAPAVAGRAGFDALFSCEAGQGHTCFYAIYDDASVPIAYFSLAHGQSIRIPVLDARNYAYVTAIDANHTTDPTCQAVPVQFSCRLEMIKPGLNK